MQSTDIQTNPAPESSRAGAKFIEYTLPAVWACALVDGDRSGLTDDDDRELGEWLAVNGQDLPMFYCVGVSGCAAWQHEHDATNGGVRAADCLEFTFQIQ
jgi:hypothetical protein